MRGRSRSIALGLGLGWAAVVLVVLSGMGNPVDAGCYYGLDPTQPWTPDGCFLYSPPVALAMDGVKVLVSFGTFTLLLRAAELAVLILVSGPAVGLLLFVPAVVIELNAANVNLLIVAAVLVGFRYPWAWAFVVLTKITPGVGLLWFAVRREWRNLAIAAGATVALAVASWLVAPDLWPKYLIGLGNASDDSVWQIWWRLPIAAVVVTWGAGHDHRWALIVAVFLALPRWYFLSPVVLVGLFPLVRLPRPLPWAIRPAWLRPSVTPPVAARPEPHPASVPT